MTDRPILFSAPMVRALLDGSKTQTRRVVKRLEVRAGMPEPEWQSLLRCCPYGQPGDRLWVRETWGYRSGQGAPGRGLGQATIEYRADGARATHYRPPDGIPNGLPKQRPCRTDEDHGTYCDVYLTKYWRQWRPSIFMPRWASRISLEIARVRVERLQDISEADSQAEGIVGRRIGTGDARTGCRDAFGLACDDNAWAVSPSQAYQALWEQINGPGSWNENPWVWVIEFKRITP